MENKNNVDNQDIKSSDEQQAELKKEVEKKENLNKHKNGHLAKSNKKEDFKKLKANYEDKLEKANLQISNLQQKIIDLEIEQAKNIDDFKNKAQSFATKAHEEIAKHKAEINKQVEEEKANLQKYGSQKLLESIMEPILNIEIAVQSGKKNPATNAYVVGFEMLLGQFYNELNSFGVTKISPQVNEEFDPNLHYAISTKPGTPKQKHKIIEIKKEGFKLYDRVLKPATVIIGE